MPNCNPYDELSLLSIGMEAGDSLRELCPFCGGGSSREKSLSITLDDSGVLLWKCFRASCGKGGKKLLWGICQDYASRPKKLGKTFTGLLEPLSKTQVELIGETYGLDIPNSWRSAPEYSRLYIPVIGPRGEERGAILRTLPGSELSPKTLTFKHCFDEPWQSWGHCHTGRPFDNHLPPVIVEDMFSAAKVQQSGIPSICLLGTHLSLDKVREIVSYYPEAVLALDKDAYEKAVGYAGTFRHLIGLKVWKLELDLKYVSSDRIREAYYNNKTDFTLERETTTISRNPLP